MEPWTKFRNLCHYYADCVKYSEKSQEYLFPDQLGKTIMMPRLPMNWHLQDNEFEIDTSKDDAFVRAQLLKGSDESEIFIGYPLNAFVSPAGFECLCPLLMFPINIAVRGQGYTTGLKMRIDRQGISVNQDWIEYHLPKDQQRAFQIACNQTEDESGCLDVAMVLNYLSAHFKPINFNPNLLEFTLRNSCAKNKLLNSAVLFEGTKTKYTKTLLSELRRISKEPDAVLDKTALAYAFRDPPLPPSTVDAAHKRIPVSFTKFDLNAGQFAAVEASLNQPAVKVMIRKSRHRTSSTLIGGSRKRMWTSVATKLNRFCATVSRLPILKWARHCKTQRKQPLKLRCRHTGTPKFISPSIPNCANQ